MDISLDCRGLACPGPVLRCKKCVEADAPQTLTVAVDNEAARENVSRFLSMRGYVVTVDQQADGLSTVTAVAGDATAPSAAATADDRRLKPERRPDRRFHYRRRHRPGRRRPRGQAHEQFSGHPARTGREAVAHRPGQRRRASRRGRQFRPGPAQEP